MQCCFKQNFPISLNVLFNFNIKMCDIVMRCHIILCIISLCYFFLVWLPNTYVHTKCTRYLFVCCDADSDRAGKSLFAWHLTEKYGIYKLLS